MKREFEVTTDEELAACLGKSKQTVSGWRRREKVPESIVSEMTRRFGITYIRVEERDVSEPYDAEDYAVAAALLAFSEWMKNRALTDQELLCASRSLRDVQNVVAAFRMINADFRRDESCHGLHEAIRLEMGRAERLIEPINVALRTHT